MKPPFTKDGCKTIAFYSISICIALTVLLSIISIWNLTSSEILIRLVYSLFTILGGILIFTVINVLFILSEQDEILDEKTSSESTISRALKDAKIGD